MERGENKLLSWFASHSSPFSAFLTTAISGQAPSHCMPRRSLAGGAGCAGGWLYLPEPRIGDIPFSRTQKKTRVCGEVKNSIEKTQAGATWRVARPAESSKAVQQRGLCVLSFALLCHGNQEKMTHSSVVGKPNGLEPNTYMHATTHTSFQS